MITSCHLLSHCLKLVHLARLLQYTEQIFAKDVASIKNMEIIVFFFMYERFIFNFNPRKSFLNVKQRHGKKWQCSYCVVDKKKNKMMDVLHVLGANISLSVSFSLH